MGKYAVILAIVLTLVWMALTGYFQPLMIVFGVISISTVVLLCARMDILDIETAPYQHTLKTMPYFSWLFKEIVKANIDVVKAVMAPDMEIKPGMKKVSTNRNTDLGVTMFANSITLTPGTVTVAMSDDHILVHALLSDQATKESFVEMDIRSGQSVGDVNEGEEI